MSVNYIQYNIYIYIYIYIYDFFEQVSLEELNEYIEEMVTIVNYPTNTILSGVVTTSDYGQVFVYVYIIENNQQQQQQE